MIYFNTFGILVQFLGFTAHNGLLFIRIESWMSFYPAHYCASLLKS
jgi:hypothetical protein